MRQMGMTFFYEMSLGLIHVFTTLSWKWNSHPWSGIKWLITQEVIEDRSLSRENDGNCLKRSSGGWFWSKLWRKEHHQILRHVSPPCRKSRGTWSKFD
jgi:hypothetical protein